MAEKLPNVIWFEDISLAEQALVGGKAAILGELFNLRSSSFYVPFGFCLTTSAFRQFMRVNSNVRDMLTELNVLNPEALADQLKSVREAIVEGTIPLEVEADLAHAIEELQDSSRSTSESELAPFAIRSSAVAEDLPHSSFAGQMVSFLNVTRLEQALKLVRECWASLWSDRVIVYRRRRGLSDVEFDMAVIFQQFVSADKAGVIFSVNPVTRNQNEMIIEACWGLGEALVGGRMTPDMYVIDLTNRRQLRIADTKIHLKKVMVSTNPSGLTKQIDVPLERREEAVLTDLEVMRLAKIGLEISDYFERPQDIEWAILSKDIYVLQSRAITTL